MQLLLKFPYSSKFCRNIFASCLASHAVLYLLDTSCLGKLPGFLLH